MKEIRETTGSISGTACGCGDCIEIGQRVGIKGGSSGFDQAMRLKFVSYAILAVYTPCVSSEATPPVTEEE